MSSKAEEGIVETIKTVVYALLIAGVFRTLFFQPFWIPTGSMKDTLLIGDFLFVNKMAYGYSKYSCPFSACPIEGRILGSEPERGDVVVFRHPTAGTDYIKRLIGLPGDTVQIKGGLLYINGTAVEITEQPPFIETKEAQGSAGSVPRCMALENGDQCVKERAIETLPNGVSHSILNITNGGEADDTPLFTVPAKHYFFMGDNRDNSLDSRFSTARGGVDYVSEEYLIGRADRVIFSSAGKSLFYFWTWRMDRFFKAID
jgi:signal peptidase I